MPDPIPDGPTHVSTPFGSISGSEAHWSVEISKWGGAAGREIANDLVNAGVLENLKEFLYMIALLKTRPDLKQEVVDNEIRIGTVDEYKFYAERLKDEGELGNQEYLNSPYNDEKLKQRLDMKVNEISDYNSGRNANGSLGKNLKFPEPRKPTEREKRGEMSKSSTIGKDGLVYHFLDPRAKKIQGVAEEQSDRDWLDNEYGEDLPKPGESVNIDGKHGVVRGEVDQDTYGGPAEFEVKYDDGTIKIHSVDTIMTGDSSYDNEQLDELKCWPGYTRVRGVPAGAPGSCKKKTNEEHNEKCPHCGGEMVSEELMNEKKDACYYKVKSRYKVWPSAYASGALVKCRKKGAKNWGTGGKKNESINEGASTESITNAILGRIERTMPEVFSRYGDEYVYQVVSDIASFYEGAEELGSSDISAMVHSVMKHLNDKQLNELSPETLASYKKKAGAQASELDKAAFGGASDAKEKLAKAHQRFKGITKATMKQFDQPKKKVDEFVQGYNMNQAGMRKYKPKHVPNQDEIQKMSGIMEGLSKK
jgi:hypothetical protein